MANILIRPGWSAPTRWATPETALVDRRRFLRQLGLGGVGAVSSLWQGCARPADAADRAAGGPIPDSGAAVRAARLYPAPRHPDFNPKLRLTDEQTAARYNNFYEFTTAKDRVHRLAHTLPTNPWRIEVSGLVAKPMTLDAYELIAEMPLEERVYRFRCVEGWAMVVPWTGFPLRKLIEKVEPKSEARFVRFETFNRPDWAPGMADRRYPWPYFEGLRMDEALHPLTLVASGIYGKPLPKQHGAPIRLVVPWKYGYKSIKSVVKIEFVAHQPKTFWETLAPEEYPFESNVNPAVPHPRWSQATERIIDTGDRVMTLPYNGYGDYVAKLYA